MTMHIGIIGAGIAGLAAAVRMAAQGHQVSVFEANSYPGGKLSEFRQDGFRFDAGPSLFTMPHYVDDLFHIAGENPQGYFSYQQIPVICHYFWDDGTRLAASSDKSAFANAIQEKLHVPPEVIQHYLLDSQKKYELTGRIFLEKSLHKASTWLRPEIIPAMIKIPQYDLFTSMNKVNQRLVKHPKLVQLFNRYATYNGSNPFKTPGLLTIIPHFEYNIGAFYPTGGMNSISQAVWKLGERLGVQYHFNTPVDEIVVSGKTASALRIQQDIIPFDAIISNMDAFFTYRKLLPHQPAPEKTLRQEKSTSALIFYWGINQAFPELDLHNIFFSNDYKHEFNCLDKGTVSDDPTVYINITSKYTPADAPPGCETWFTMVNVPYNDGQDWDALIARTRKNVLNKLSRILGQSIEPLIISEAKLDPRSIESKTASHLGALYGTSSNNQLAAFLRHPNFSKNIRNLYFCGGSVHPGGGIPLALLSAKITADIIKEDFRGA
jgi:phytoene desaturase